MPGRLALVRARAWWRQHGWPVVTAALVVGLIGGLWWLVEALAREEGSNRLREVALQNDGYARLIEDHAARALDVRGDLNPEDFARLYADLHIGKKGAISLVGLDGVVRVRVNDGESSAGQDVSAEPAFLRMLQTRQGAFESAEMPGDATPRILSYRTTADPPLLVVVGSSLDEVLAEVRQRTAWYRAAAALASAAIVGAGVWLMLAWARQKRAEVALRGGARFLRTLTDIIPGMVSYWTPDLCCSFANRDYVHWFGLQPADIVGQHISTLLGPELYRRNTPHIRAALQGQSQQFERSIVRPDGTVGTTWVHYVPDILDGEVRGFAVWSADLTPIRNAQRKLDELHASVRVAATAFECQEGMVVTDANRCILQVNRAFVAMTGFTSAEVVGRQHVEFKSSRHGADFDHALWSEVRSLGGWRGEFWHRHQTQGDFPVRATVTAVTDPEGRVTHYVFTLIDVTDQRQQEIQRRQDEQAQRIALVREVHHRIKNNLQGIAGLLRQFEYAHPETREVMSQAIGHVQSIAVIHGLQGQGATEQVQMDALVRAIAQTQQTLRQRPVALDIPADWLGWVLAETDAVPLALILNELILNAIKHGDLHHKEVTVALAQDLVNESIQVTVVNRGTLHGPKSARPHPVQMGLSLVASLMPRSGGRLTQSQVGPDVVTILTLAGPVVVRSAPHADGDVPASASAPDFSAASTPETALQP